MHLSKYVIFSVFLQPYYKNQQSITSNVSIAESHNQESINVGKKTGPHVTEHRQNLYLSLGPKLHVHIDDAEMRWVELL